MKIALVQMPPQPRDTPPMETALTAAILRREGHQVTLYDINNDLYLETFKQRPFWKFRLTDQSLDPCLALPLLEVGKLHRHADRILADRPDTVIFKADNVYAGATTMARLLQDQATGMPIIASGVNTPDQALVRRWKSEQDGVDALNQKIMPFDCLIIGEDDLALPAALDALPTGLDSLPKEFHAEGRIVDISKGPLLKNLDELPFYDYSDYEFQRYSDCTTVRLSVSRGCPHRCSFCQDWVMGQKFRAMSAARWFAEYQHQNERHPDLIHFRHYDRLLNGDVSALDNFCDLVLARYPQPPVAWGGDFIIREEMTDQLIAKLARARCNSFGVGLESGSERVRASVGKDFFDNALAARVLASCHKHGLPVSLNVIIGLPSETRAELQETIDFIAANQRHISEVRLTAPTAMLQSGTPMARNADKFGLTSTHHEQWQTADGSNDYAERVRRFKHFCENVLALSGPRLAVNRRQVKTPAALRRLSEDLKAAPPDTSPLRRRQLALKIRMLGPWHHQIKLHGLGTRELCPDTAPGLDVPQSTMPEGRETLPLELAGRTVLDIGCSDGWHAFRARAQGAALVYGIDTDADSVRRANFAKESLSLAGIVFQDVNAYAMDHWAAREPALNGRRFDWAFLIDIIDHVPHPTLLLAKTAKVADRIFLRTMLDVSTPACALVWGPDRIDPNNPHIIGTDRADWLPTKQCLPKILKSAGFAGFETIANRPLSDGLEDVFAIAWKVS